MQTARGDAGARAAARAATPGWLLVQILRHLGLAARFASGYLIQLVADVKPLDGPAGTDHDFTDLHAWAEVFVPGRRLDRPRPDVGAARGRRSHPARVHGRSGQCRAGHRLHRSVRGRVRVRDDRHAHPRGSARHAAVHASAVGGDRRARASASTPISHARRAPHAGRRADVRVDRRHGRSRVELRALSPKKRELGGALLQPLARRFAPGGLLHYGQGKWYPGEPLPRWALGVYWRSDGEPLWRDDRVARRHDVAGELDPRDCASISPHASPSALALPAGFVHRRLRGRSEAAGGGGRAARERRSAGGGPDAARRARAPRAAARGGSRQARRIRAARPRRDRARPRRGTGRWETSPWPLRRERLYALPGDSPLGLRLPLASLPDVLPDEVEHEPPVDPFAPRRRCPHARAACVQVPAARAARRPARSSRPRCASQVRDGHLYVFMPPLQRVEDMRALLAAIEDTARALAVPVVDRRLHAAARSRVRVLNVTPDPGVIEVNIHPGIVARAHRRRPQTLYEEARQTRLGTEKFMLDGRHTGTGGGNHVTLGGATPADSPLLRRPDLLQSLITYWQNHPGAVVPVLGDVHRSDEPGAARRRSARRPPLRARDRVPADEPQAARRGRRRRCHGSSTGCLRHLLTDLTGNTHRAEFSIDKLYSPDGPTGRLGLLEFRAFEMPPHAQMSAVQMLLLRALVARFWQEPYAGGLVRWGTALHDRWLLPHFVGGRPPRRRRRPRPRSATRSRRNGSRRSSSSASRASARSTTTASRSSCARRSSRGTCWARR